MSEDEILASCTLYDPGVLALNANSSAVQPRATDLTPTISCT